MKILLTNHQLTHFTGTEVFTYTLAKELKKRGHDVTVYSAYIGGNLHPLFDEVGVPLYSDIRKIKDVFDIAHVHHNINALEVRDRFPALPMVYMSHGVLPELEQPPLVDLGISKFLAISEEVKKNITKYGVPESRIVILRNIIDEERFYPMSPINEFPQKALVISNKIDTDTENTIKSACDRLGIVCNFIGSRFKTVANDEMPAIINQHDLIFSLGRGVMEAMFCGRIPIVIDTKVGDGMVTRDNFYDLITYHFSGRVYWKVFSVEELVDEIRKYDAKNGELLRELALNEFSIKSQTDKLVKIYEDVANGGSQVIGDKEKSLSKYISRSIQNTRYQT